MLWNAVSRLQSDLDSRPHKGEQSRLKTGQSYLPQDYIQSASPDPSLLLTQVAHAQHRREHAKDGLDFRGLD